MIVTKDKLDKNVEEEFWLEVKRVLVFAGIIPEIIIVSKDELEKYGRFYGFVHHQALTEGKVL